MQPTASYDHSWSASRIRLPEPTPGSSSRSSTSGSAPRMTPTSAYGLTISKFKTSTSTNTKVNALCERVCVCVFAVCVFAAIDSCGVRLMGARKFIYCSGKSKIWNVDGCFSFFSFSFFLGVGVIFYRRIGRINYEANEIRKIEILLFNNVESSVGIFFGGWFPETIYEQTITINSYLPSK